MTSGFRTIENIYSKDKDEIIGGNDEFKKSSYRNWIAAFLVSATVLIFVAISVAIIAVCKTKDSTQPKVAETTSSLISMSAGATTVKLNVPADQSQEVCTTKECVQAASSMLSALDTATDPCEDFHSFVCGKYHDHQEIPQDREIYGQMYLIEYKVIKAVKAILEGPLKTGEFKGLNMAKKFYKSCQTQENQYLNGSWSFVKDNIAKSFGIWPMKVGQWSPPVLYSWEKQVVQLIRFGIESILKVEVVPDPTNTTRTVIQMTAFPPANNNYDEDIIAKMDNISYINDSKDLQFFKDSMNQVLFNPFRRVRKTIKEIKDYIPKVNWDIIFSIFDDKIRLNDNDTVIIVSWKQFVHKMNHLSKIPLRVVQNHIHESFYYGINYHLPKQTDESDSGRWKNCVKHTVNYFGFIISAAYVEKHLDADIIAKVAPMLQELRTVLTEKIQKADWLDDETREHALAKVKLMHVKVGYPKSLLNKSLLMQDLDQVDTDQNDFFQNNIKLTYIMKRQNLNTLRGPIQREAWTVPPITSNAYYIPLTNEIVLPAAILQFPALSGHVPAYLNYGRLGMIIGHEMTHGFDSSGNLFNEFGDIQLWWTNFTQVNFFTKENCFLAQFNNIEDPVSGLKLYGDTTLGENMADTGGMKLSYTAFMRWLSNHPNMPTLPGLDKYSAEQLFFISFANFLCKIYTPAGRKTAIEDDVHILEKYRINYSLQNLAEFGDAFNCPNNSKMTPKDRCEMW